MKSHSIEILQNPNLISSNKSRDLLNYRLLLCSIIFRRKHKLNNSDIRTNIEKIFKYTEQFNKGPVNQGKEYIADFIEFYTIKNDQTNMYGFVVHDRTDGVYPLICFPEGESQEIGNRVKAFKVATENILNSLDEILKIIRNEESWETCKEKLDEYFYSSKAA